MREQSLDNSISRLIKEGPSRTSYGRIRSSEDFTFFGITKTINGTPQQSLALKLILESGEQYAVQYHELTSPMRFNGADQIKISTPYLSITIKGRRLEDIFDYLAEFRIVWIKEPDSDFMQVESNEPQVEQIVVEMTN